MSDLQIFIFIIFIILNIGILIWYTQFYKKNNKKNKLKQYKKNNIAEILLNSITTKDIPILWLYWEGEMPDYIKMCKETIYRHCSNSFEIIFLNDKNIDSYLPELKEKNLDFSNLKIAQKVDYYRILLLYKYGGLYMDMDILVLKDLSEITDKLNKYDFVGFGCTGYKCKYGYGKPSNWLLASKPNTILFKNILQSYENKLYEFNKLNKKSDKSTYFDFGKNLIWEELDKLINGGYKYYHYPNTVDGTRDKDGMWVTMGRLFSKEYIKYDNPEDLLMVVLYNSDLDDFDKKYRIMTKEELIKLDINFSKQYKKSVSF
jgi:hypothetical protein